MTALAEGLSTSMAGGIGRHCPLVAKRCPCYSSPERRTSLNAWQNIPPHIPHSLPPQMVLGVARGLKSPVLCVPPGLGGTLRGSYPSGSKEGPGQL